MQKLNAKQKAIAIGCVAGLVVLAAIGGRYAWQLKQGNINSQLSDRSEEFFERSPR